MATVIFSESLFRDLYPAFADEVKCPDAALADCELGFAGFEN